MPTLQIRIPCQDHVANLPLWTGALSLSLSLSVFSGKLKNRADNRVEGQGFGESPSSITMLRSLLNTATPVLSWSSLPQLSRCTLYFSFPRSCHFEALKSPPPAPSLTRPKPPPPPPQVDDELKAVLGDDLSTRFAALRGSLHPFSSSSSSPSVASANLVPSRTSLACDGRVRDPSYSNPTMRRMKSRRSSNGPRTLRISIALLRLMKSLMTMTMMRIATLK
ncbi:hypothetical protein CRG98_022032 [Punica granatum]|uniref:Uncharacterized protein n=1 Tax=Punica granatum TaxID=22663 RepID=A0A2I0JMQ5_PUNGR|nr:hypothetical protein CRG98_022032 [Punica granatum]